MKTDYLGLSEVKSQYQSKCETVEDSNLKVLTGPY